MLPVYLGALAFGGTLLVASLLLGFGHHDADGAGHDHDKGHDKGSDGFGWLPVASVRFWTFFLGFGGLAGTLLTYATGTAWPIVAGASAVVGWASGVGVVAAMRRVKDGPGSELSTKELDELKMGALSAVGRGSRNEPRLIVLRHDPPGAPDDVFLGLVGKSITFDTGGISLKSAPGMESMKGDMAGGAGTLHGMGAIAALGLPVRAVAVLAAAENMPGGDAFRPGDILRAANGKTIEIINTDAEGRLVLADALWYARREGATHILELSTLTGAMELALGDLYAGYFTNDDTWSDRIFRAGNRSGDLAWRFPLHERYRRYIDSAFADMKNGSTLRQGSPALAAKFLEEFAGDGPWAHVDMAGPGFLERSRGDYLRVPGGTGYGVRLIAQLAELIAREL